MLGTLIKVESTHNNIRTEETKGAFDFLPEVDGRFEIISEPLDPKMNFRLISTSIIQSVTKINDNFYEFKTLNSTYRLKILDSQA